MAAKPVRRQVALVAHDNKKVELLRWAEYNRGVLAQHDLYATGTTGTMLEYELGLPVRRFLSGPVGGDQQIGALIAEGTVSALFFFIDALSPMPHDVDVKALTRLAVHYDIPMALNRRTAEILIANPAMLSSGGGP